MSTLWTRAFWQTRDGKSLRPRRIPRAMIVAVALTAACTIGLGLVVEPVVRFSRTAAAQMGPGVSAASLP